MSTASYSTQMLHSLLALMFMFGIVIAVSSLIGFTLFMIFGKEDEASMAAHLRDTRADKPLDNAA